MDPNDSATDIIEATPNNEKEPSTASIVESHAESSESAAPTNESSNEINAAEAESAKDAGEVDEAQAGEKTADEQAAPVDASAPAEEPASAAQSDPAPEKPPVVEPAPVISSSSPHCISTDGGTIIILRGSDFAEGCKVEIGSTT